MKPQSSAKESQRKIAAKVKLHPDSHKYLNKGHPWVIKDNYTNRFPSQNTFLLANDHARLTQYYMLHDPSHPQVKARLWHIGQGFPQDIDEFFTEMNSRIDQAINKREKFNLDHERENYYVIFGENDQLPGLFVQKLGNALLFQFYASYWEKFKKELIAHLRLSFPEEQFIFQKRNKNQNIKFSFEPHLNPPYSPIVKEFGVSYQLHFGQNYDFGLYTDMAAIRKKLTPIFKESKKVLNLYSYTGAYSLFAFSQGVPEVHSVDLSPKYMDWLEENLELNSQFEGEHYAHITSVEDFLRKNKTKYDCIVCDPPSASTDGKQRSNALKKYEVLLPLLSKSLTTSGKLIIFLNTHQIKFKKFKEKIEKLLNPNIKIKGNVKLEEDCPILSQFPEGSYLKGLILEKEKIE